MIIAFVVPGPPVPKARARVSIRAGKVRAHTPPKTAAYERLVGVAARVARPHAWPMRCSYRVSFDVLVAVDNADIDNYLKSLLDGAQGVLWANDKSVRRLGGCNVVVGAPKPCMTVRVEALPVPCSRGACSAETLYPDDDGRCPACPVKHRTKRA